MARDPAKRLKRRMRLQAKVKSRRGQRPKKQVKFIKSKVFHQTSMPMPVAIAAVRKDTAASAQPEQLGGQGDPHGGLSAREQTVRARLVALFHHPVLGQFFDCYCLKLIHPLPEPTINDIARRLVHTAQLSAEEFYRNFMLGLVQNLFTAALRYHDMQVERQPNSFMRCVAKTRDGAIYQARRYARYLTKDPLCEKQNTLFEIMEMFLPARLEILRQPHQPELSVSIGTMGPGSTSCPSHPLYGRSHEEGPVSMSTFKEELGTHDGYMRCWLQRELISVVRDIDKWLELRGPSLFWLQQASRDEFHEQINEEYLRCLERQRRLEGEDIYESDASDAMLTDEPSTSTLPLTGQAMLIQQMNHLAI